MIILRVATLSLAVALALAACKDTSSAGTDVPTGSNTPPPAGSSGTDTDAPAQTQGGDVPAGPESTFVECAPDSRKGGMCTREYRPVCGQKTDGTFASYPNKCNACSDLAVQRYKDGSCETAGAPQ